MKVLALRSLGFAGYTSFTQAFGLDEPACLRFLSSRSCSSSDWAYNRQPIGVITVGRSLPVLCQSRIVFAETSSSLAAWLVVRNIVVISFSL
jgi:hypothetical protein